MLCRKRRRVAELCRSDAVVRKMQKVLKQQSLHKAFDRRKDVAKNKDADQNPGHRERAAAHPVDIAAGAVFAHEEHDYRTAIERRNRDQVKHTEQKIEREERKEKLSTDVWMTVGAQANEMKSRRSVQANRAEKHKGEICRRTSEGHECGAMRVASRPMGIIRSAGETNHSSVH